MIWGALVLSLLAVVVLLLGALLLSNLVLVLLPFRESVYRVHVSIHSRFKKK